MSLIYGEGGGPLTLADGFKRYRWGANLNVGFDIHTTNGYLRIPGPGTPYGNAMNPGGIVNQNLGDGIRGHMPTGVTVVKIIFDFINYF